MLLLAGFTAGVVFFAIIKPYLDSVVNELGVMVANTETLNTEPVYASEVHFTSKVIDSEASSMAEVLQHTQGYRKYQPVLISKNLGKSHWRIDKLEVL